MHSNISIIPYVPIAPRVQATNQKSKILLKHFFTLIDKVINAQICFNHDTRKGLLSISPEQINDLIDQISKNDYSIEKVDVIQIKSSLCDLIYPKFGGEHTVISPIWNKTEVTVWQFQLNQIANRVNMENSENETEQLLDMTISSLRIWRQSLEASNRNPDVTYSVDDLVYKLLDMELKLKHVQMMLEL